jgi:hypothetical protein
MQHQWISSTLGHGETMCARCFITNREAAALGISDACDVPSKPPQTANDNQPTPTIDEYPDDDNEYDSDDDDWLDMECGLRADGQCGMAGTEHCDFSCPNRDSEDFAGSAAWNKKHGARLR